MIASVVAAWRIETVSFWVVVAVAVAARVKMTVQPLTQTMVEQPIVVSLVFVAYGPMFDQCEEFLLLDSRSCQSPQPWWSWWR